MRLEPGLGAEAGKAVEVFDVGCRFHNPKTLRFAAKRVKFSKNFYRLRKVTFHVQ